VNVGLNLAGGGGNDVYDRCLPTPDGAPDQGLFNRATLTQPGQPGRDADACGDVPNIVHDKEFVSATAAEQATRGTWSTASSATNNGGASGVYTLSDQPAMDNDVTINSASFVVDSCRATAHWHGNWPVDQRWRRTRASTRVRATSTP
jgi:hypothetical protein